jgi:hypothetical protein
MRLPHLSIAVLAAAASVAAAPTSAAFAQGLDALDGGFAAGGGAASAGTPRVETATEAQTRLYVKTLPPGARVTLDGRPLGASDGLFLVPAGAGKVSVQFGGAEPEVRQVEIVEGRITRVEIAAGTTGAAAAAAARDPSESLAARFPPTLHAGQAAGMRRVPPRLTSTRERVAAKPLTAIDGMLDQPLEQPLEFHETSLRAVIDRFREVAGIDVLIDGRGLEDAGLDLDTPITARLPAGLSLAAALDVALREADLAWIVRDDLLEVTTPEHAETRVLVRVHDVPDLAATADGLFALIDLVTTAVAPETWKSEGGPGAIVLDSTAIVVSQTWQVQRQVAGFLEVLRRLKATPADARRPIGIGGYWSDQPAAVAARAALAKPVTAGFHDAPLRDVLSLGEQVGVPIGADRRALEDHGLDLDTPITFAVSGTPLAVVLDRILEPMDLVAEVRAEGLVVTTPSRSEGTMTVAVYPVGHLVGGDRSVDSLADVMMSQVEFPRYELELDRRRRIGGAVVLPVDGDMPGLVVLHTTAGHRAVHELLESLPPSRQPGGFAPTLEADPDGGLSGSASEATGRRRP